MAATIASSLQFGSNFFTAVVQSGTLGGAQAILSPLSVWFALILLFNGAGPLSQTQQELARALISPSLPVGSKANPAAAAAAVAAFNNQTSALQARLRKQATGSIQLAIANAVWTKQSSVKPAYADQMKTLFDANVQSVSSAAPINAWAAKATNGLITQAVPANLDFNTLITNAVYFKGQWEYAFDKTLTKKRDFTAATSSGASKVVQVDMMSRFFNPRQLQGQQPIRYADVAGQYRAIKLPYRGSTGLAAVAVLPDKKYKDIFEAAAAITAEKVMDRGTWVNLFDVGSLSVSLPRFKVSVTQLSLTKALQAMGIKAAFDAKLADFSRMSDSPLSVSNVLQSAVVQVDEAGTEAAAVTAVVMVTSIPITRNTPPPLVFDRPFLFFLVDDTTQTVLFQGLVTDPSKA